MAPRLLPTPELSATKHRSVGAFVCPGSPSAQLSAGSPLSGASEELGQCTESQGAGQAQLPTLLLAEALEPAARLCLILTLKMGDSHFHECWHLHPQRAASSQPLRDLAIANLSCINPKSPPGIRVSV